MGPMLWEAPDESTGPSSVASSGDAAQVLTTKRQADPAGAEGRFSVTASRVGLRATQTALWGELEGISCIVTAMALAVGDDDSPDQSTGAPTPYH